MGSVFEVSWRAEFTGLNVWSEFDIVIALAEVSDGGSKSDGGIWVLSTGASAPRI